MEESERLDSELQEFQYEGSDVMSQDDDDEVEELQNSLREVVQDRSVKPKLQCLMVDPSFSMVTVQSEDSGIVWETASSRCSTPWASETSSTSEAYSMEGSGSAGKITIVFDEDKVVRRRTRSGGRSSRLGDRLSRPGSSRSASALGVERPEMAEVSLPNVKQEDRKAEADLEEIKNKDQQLFSLISEGYEILNIRVPSKLPTVDEEETTELQDNLSYLDQTPKIRSKIHQDRVEHKSDDFPEEEKIADQAQKDRSSQPPGETGDASIPRENTSDFDYFEKFTLLDVVVPAEQSSKLQEEEKPEAEPQSEDTKPAKDEVADAPSEDSFVFVTDGDVVGEHLDEVFYGEAAPVDALQQDKEEVETRMRGRRESQRSAKEGGSVLFEGEETTLTPIFISPGPPKIIDPILLEEPTAMSFMYSDLYEDAVGERRRSDEECSEAESVASEKSYKRRLSDSEEADGYLEKFTLKDETPSADAHDDSSKDKSEGRMLWPQSKFEMSGCLIRVTKEEEKKEEPKMEETPTEGVHHAVITEEKEETVEEPEEEKIERQIPTETAGETKEHLIQEGTFIKELTKNEEVKHIDEFDSPKPDESKTKTEEAKMQEFVKPLNQIETVEKEENSTNLFIVSDEQTAGEISEKSTSEITKIEEQIEVRLVKSEDETKQTAWLEPSPEKPPETQEPDERTDHQREEESSTDATPTHEPRVAAEIKPEVLETMTESTESTKTEKILLEVGDSDQELKIEPQTEVLILSKEAETVTLMSNEPVTEVEKPAEDHQSEILKAEDVCPVEVSTDWDCSVQTVVEVTEEAVNEKEIQTHVRIDLQEFVQTEVIEKETKSSIEKSVSEEILLEPKLESVVPFTTSSIPAEAITESAEKPLEVPETEQQQQETKSNSIEESRVSEEKSEIPKDETTSRAEDVGDVDDEFILLVPKGETVEMDIEISQWIEKSPEEKVAEPDGEKDSQVELKPEDEAKEEELPGDGLDLPAAPEEQIITEENLVSEEVNIKSSSLEDLSGLHSGEVLPGTDAETKAKMEELKDASETDVLTNDAAPFTDLDSEDIKDKIEKDENVLEASVMPVDELEYEVISQQDAKDTLESETRRVAEESQEGEEVEGCVDIDQTEDHVSEEELIEADYDIIDAEEESQARLAAELEGMDWFCVTCERLLSEEEYKSAEHQDHEVNSVDKAYEEVKDVLGGWISELQARSENIEDLVSELELAYNSVEDQFMASEAAMQAQNEEMMALVMEQYNTMSVSMEEEKKAKLEQLYDKIVSFQENIDSAKVTLETAAREAETDARSPEDIQARLKEALDAASSLELGPKGLLVFEDYAKANTSSSNLTQRKGIPVPQKPILQHQESGSATSTSVTVYWKVNPGDIIDCFQVYCMEDPQGAVTEEYRVTVKESYCVLEELEPDKMYKVWVMAVNYTGCSLPSERLVFRTAPSVPVIDTERCTVLWDSATLRWSSNKQIPGQTHTLEYCRQYELEGEGLRSISGIKTFEQRVLLQPNENYLFYIKAVNEAGVSEQSEAALVSTKATRFHLLKNSAHPSLELSEDQTTLHCSQDALTDQKCPSILGDLLPARGVYYWETDVSGSTAYRLGVESSSANRKSSLGENNSSWCLQCVSTELGYQLLHNNIQSIVCVTDKPERVGTLLDFQQGFLSFYNPKNGQLLGSFRQRFRQPCHPALALEEPGSLQLCLVSEVPEFTKVS